ncbi:unnamed protein product [Urochloa decumbens]|uniref:Uncharacterized protein n=1 Tax=Urochloa decumbens TaxID=240449 RepID=A0ABC9FLX5_9POAL
MAPPPSPPPAPMSELVEEILLRVLSTTRRRQASSAPPSSANPGAASSPAPTSAAGLRELRRGRVVPMLGFLCDLRDGGVSLARFVPRGALLLPPASRRRFPRPAGAQRAPRPRPPPYGRGYPDLPPSSSVTPSRTSGGSLPGRRCTRTAGWEATVLCAATTAGAGAYDHVDCHRGPFIVVFVGTDDSGMFTYVYSSEAVAWSKLVTARALGARVWDYEVEVWVLRKVINLKKLLFLDRSSADIPQLVRFAEGVGVVFLNVGDETFTVGLSMESRWARKVYDGSSISCAVPYINSCTPVLGAPTTDDGTRSWCLKSRTHMRGQRHSQSSTGSIFHR